MPDLANGVLIALDAEAAARPFWIDLIPFLLIAAIMYFLILRPEQQKRAAHEELIDSLVKGNWVITQGGLHGQIVTVNDATVVLEIADKTRVTFDKSSVTRRLDAE